MLNMKSTGQMIKTARDKLRLTQEELAAQLHVSKQAVSNWERGVNSIDEDIRGRLEHCLHIKLNEDNSPEVKIMTVPALRDIKDFNTILDCAEKIAAEIETDSPFSTSIKELLRKLILLSVAYTVYYEGALHVYDDEPACWGSVGANLFDLVSREEAIYVFNLHNTSVCVNSYGGNEVLAKIEFAARRIGGILFEDFDDEGTYHSGYPQQIGRIGQAAGYDLVAVLPDTDNSLVTAFKIAAIKLSEYLEAIE